MSASIDSARISSYVDKQWEESILPALSDFIEIPALSPAFDAEWEANGHLEATIELATAWIDGIAVEGISYGVHRIAGHTPLLLVEIAGTGSGEVLFYSHLDKQPEFTGWSEGKGPWIPVREDPWLFGRGSVDDGYGNFCGILAVQALQEQGIPHPTCRFLIETCEESGSFDLPDYLELLKGDLGNPDLVIVLDSGAGDYDRLWVTTSLRGLVSGELCVAVSREGVHSGMAGGVIPSSFRIARSLLSRLEDEVTGEITLDELHVDISRQLRAEAQTIVDILGAAVWKDFPFLEGVQPQVSDEVEVVLNQNWRPSLSITGADGMPSLNDAGNVLRSNTDLKISLRIPPGVDADAATQAVKELLEMEPPHGAQVVFKEQWAANGFRAPELAHRIESALDAASQQHFGNGSVAFFEGGTIPFLSMMQESYPATQFLVTGPSGPGNNAHGPDEKLHIPAAKALTCCISSALAALCE